MMSLCRQLRGNRVVCTVGSGGVGKTTCAAAFGLMACTQGRRALVLTIDPARRLASAMGLGSLTGEERILGVDHLRELGIPAQQPLAVRMLDLKQAWDGMVRRLSPSAEQAEAILGNRFYTYLSTELAGAQEYIACEQLYTLSYERDFDVVILDTPPTAHALDFLDAPSRILSILDNDAVKWAAGSAMMAGKLSLRILDVAASAANKALEKLAGVDMLRELGDFLMLFEGLFEPLRARTAAVQSLLFGPDTSFILVASPEHGPLRQALYFQERLAAWKLTLGAVVVNRVRKAPHDEPDLTLARATLITNGLSAEGAEQLVAAAHRALEFARRAARQDARAMAPLRRAAKGVPFLQVPRFTDEVHDLKGLWRLAGHLARRHGDEDGSAK